MAFLASMLLALVTGTPPIAIPTRPPSEPVVYPSILVSVDEADENRKALLFVDTRPEEAYKAGHIPGALHLEPSTFASRAHQIGDSESIVLYGDESSYETLAWMFFTLEAQGHESVRILDGGYPAWSRKAQTSPERGFKTRLTAGSMPTANVPGDARVVDQEWVRKQLNRPAVEILDVRFENQGLGTTWPAGFRNGHIPLALPFDFAQLLPGEAYWPVPQTARQSFAQIGPRPREHVNLDATFIVYGENAQDLKPHLGYLLLKLMGIEARIFVGGWEAWAGEPRWPRIHVISAQKAKELRSGKEALFIDVRDEWDHRLGHIPGAINIPAYRFREGFGEWVQENSVPLNAALVFYCYGVECTRSRTSSATAAELGFSELYWFKGGLDAWKDLGESVDRVPLPLPTTKVFDDTPGAEHPD